MDIMNRLPVKSLLLFRVVSKQWKFSIDSFDFIRNYGCRERNTCCFNLSFRHNNQGYIHSFDENLTFRNFDSNLDVFSLKPVASSEGVWCFSYLQNSFLLLWNPSIKKSVGISVPNYIRQPDSPKMIFGFGIRPVTLEPTILKINYPLYTEGPWFVSVSTLSSRTWYNLDYDCLPRPSIRIKRSGQAVIDGKNFWIGSEKFYNDDGISNKIYLIVSFDLVTHQFHVQDMPEQVVVGEFSPPYYISQLGDSVIISGSFDFGNFRFIYAWALDFQDGFISSCSLLFNFPHPAGHFLKLLGFTNGNQPIVEAEIVQQWYRSLQVFHPIIEEFVNIGVEANRDSFFIGPHKESLILLTEPNYIAIMKMVPYEAFACRCGKGDVVLRESYQPNTRGKLYYACPRSKPKENDFGCKFFLWKEERVRLLISSPGSSSTPSYSSEPSSPNSYSSGTTTPQNHHSGTSISGGCSNCKHLLAKIKVLEAAVEMHMHPEQHTRNSTALLHELYNDMDNLGLE
ncbi:F-box domain containing protein [Tanacetum coccineum]|uniref:F-box domain containing protein n=1 Tax=Tanacetum coccineum TaxID=301880 RepID=A0ABQ4X399_9ASTR